MRILVCGGRDYADEDVVARVLTDAFTFWIRSSDEPFVIVHGDARGADRLAGAWADAYPDILVNEPHPADWTRYGRRAGPIRNQEMLDSGIDLVIAFPGGRGTADMVHRARKAGVKVKEVVTKL
jgi:hypothetical protein